ncbi:MAG TPA: DUF4080 domain-containing protein [Clostridiaceae bacterium]|nr:DUF4080 domain-containing protein [Clostridiaceae bacterium]
MAKVALIALNSSYSHTNLALRYIREKLADLRIADLEIFFLEKTINDQWFNLFDELVNLRADIYAFSCYIWNRSLVESLSFHLKQIRPETAIIWGGPDVSSQAQLMLNAHPWLDGLIQTEGDSATVEWILRYLGYEKFDVERLSGASEELSWEFPYTASEMQHLNERILYYEGSRGCAYNCTYCLSSNTYRVRHKPLSEVFAELQWIMQFNPRQLKFIDRTFNSDPQRAFAIWQFIMRQTEELKTRTNFHFEIAAELMTEEQLTLLSELKPGLFQFEIGAQTTNPEVLRTIRRPYQAEHYNNIVRQLRNMENIHLHLDLIAGLPGESLESQIKSANDLLLLRPNMLQMGFLKVLPDTKMKTDCEQRGAIYQTMPPYEILQSDRMSVKDLMYLRKIENVLNLYYNSGHYFYSINYLMLLTEQPFAVILELYDWLRPNLEQGAIARSTQIELFYRFGMNYLENNSSVEELTNHQILFADLLKLDYFLQGFKGYPNWFTDLQQTDQAILKDATEKAMILYRKAGHKVRARFECFHFSLIDLPGFSPAQHKQFSGVGVVQPSPTRVLAYLKEQSKKKEDKLSSLYICALQLGQGPVKVIAEYQLIDILQRSGL